jgi:RHS repeat-associated protein
VANYADQRYYAGNMSGRFLTADPYEASGGAAEPGSWNRYSYVLGDPIGYHDKSGLLACTGSVENGTYRCYESITVTDKPDPVMAWMPRFPNGLEPGWTSPYTDDQEERIYSHGVSMAKANICNAVPDAVVNSIQITTGVAFPVTTSLDMVYNLNTGQTTLFMSMGVGVGPVMGGAITAMPFGATWGIGSNNGAYGGGATSFSASFFDFIAGQVSLSSDGLSGLGYASDADFLYNGGARTVMVGGSIATPNPMGMRVSGNIGLSNTVGQWDLGNQNPFEGTPQAPAVAFLKAVKGCCNGQ